MNKELIAKRAVLLINDDFDRKVDDIGTYFGIYGRSGVIRYCVSFVYEYVQGQKAKTSPTPPDTTKI